MQEKTAYELQQAYEELDQFCHTLSHDIRAPLYVIHQLAELLQNEIRKGNMEEAETICGMLSDKASQAASMTEGLHRFSSAFYEQLNRQSVDMNRLFDEVFDELSMLEKNRIIQFDRKDMPEAWADPVLLKVVIQNVLSNAIKFTRNRNVARICAEAVETDTEICYSVTDNGIGFDEQYSDEVFRLFGRVNISEDFEGDGIGMATVKRIMFRHGGDVKITSRPGEGASVRLILPRREQV